ncbi:MAG: PqqD family protein [Tepidisphaeraceae bacterium]|jgi:hypothetical protein
MSRITSLAVNDEGFVFDPNTGNSFHASQIALVMLKGLREGKSEDDIAQLLAEEYEVSLADAKHDVVDFKQRLKALELA